MESINECAILFVISELVSGLLCCSTPAAAYHHHHQRLDLNMTLPDHDSTDWRQPWTPHARTMDWVQEVQAAGRRATTAAVPASAAAATTGHPALCGQDCGDGFCYNVWSNTVHV